MSSRRINNIPTSYDESVMTAMAVVPQNNNRNVTTMFHPVIEGCNPSGSNVASLNKCMKVSSNFTINEGTEVVLFNLSARGRDIAKRYTFNDYGHLELIDTIRSPFNTAQYRLQKAVSGVVSIYCNTITGTDFTLSGQCTSLALYDLPTPPPRYEDAPKYSIMPTFSRVNVSLEDGVTNIMLPTPQDFVAPPMINTRYESVSYAEACTQEPIAQTRMVSGTNTSGETTYTTFTIASSFYLAGAPILIRSFSSHGSSISFQLFRTNGNDFENVSQPFEHTFVLGEPFEFRVDMPADFDELRIGVASTDQNEKEMFIEVYSLDPILYRDSDLKHLVYLQGSLSPKNIVVSGELRKQVVPLTEFIPVTELKVQIPYDPKVFEACAMLAQMPDYGIVMKRSEYMQLSMVTMDQVACVSNGECGIADYWKMAVAALKKIGIKPAELGKKLLDAGAKFGRNMLERAERSGYADDEETYQQMDLRGYCSDYEENSFTIELDFPEFPERGERPQEVSTGPSQELIIFIPSKSIILQPGGIPVKQTWLKMPNKLVILRTKLIQFEKDPEMVKRERASIPPGVDKSKVIFGPHVEYSTEEITISREEAKLLEREAVMNTSRILKEQKSRFEVKRPDKKPKIQRKVGHCMFTDQEKYKKMDWSALMDSSDDDEDQPVETAEQLDNFVQKEVGETVVEKVENAFEQATDAAGTLNFEATEVKDAQTNIPQRAFDKFAKSLDVGVKESKEFYQTMIFFKLNGGWNTYITSLYSSTEIGREEWKKIVEQHNGLIPQSIAETKIDVIRKDMVTPDPEKRMFQPFLVQVANKPQMATVIVYFDEREPDPERYHIEHYDKEKNFGLALSSIMTTTMFGSMSYPTNEGDKVTSGTGLLDLLVKTPQWRALCSSINANAKKAKRRCYLYVEFDTTLEELEGSSFIGALDCAMFAKCPTLFIEYTLCFFGDVAWPNMVGIGYKQMAFNHATAKNLLPKWWPTTLPVSMWYQTPKAFASWVDGADIMPIPFNAALSQDIATTPILAGPFDRGWLFDFLPPQLVKTDVDLGADGITRVMDKLTHYSPTHANSKKRYLKNLATVKSYLADMTPGKWKAFAMMTTPVNRSYIEAAMTGTKKLYPAALSAIMSVLAQINSVHFFTAYRRLAEYETWLSKQGIDREVLTDAEDRQYLKMFKDQRGEKAKPKDKAAQAQRRKANQKENSEWLYNRLAAGDAPAGEELISFSQNKQKQVPAAIANQIKKYGSK